MNILKNKIIDEIINRLLPLENRYPEEIKKIKEEVKSNNYNSLDEFLENNYKDTPYSKEFKIFVQALVEKEIIPNSYLEKINIQNTNEEEKIDNLRKTILASQLEYLNDANGFIKKLEYMNTNDLYKTLIDLNDIRFIQHSISNLSYDTLNKLLDYVQENKHNSINIFIEEAIKKNLHKKNDN
jgi:hypothetical protein